MPCDDVTEKIRVQIDQADALVGYRLIKRTCGRAVGEESLLAARFAGTAAQTLVALSDDDFAAGIPDCDEVEEFLHFKHFFALQSALRILLGVDSGSDGEVCRAAAITFEGGMCTIDAEISVDVVTERIKACGKCKGCGVRKAAPALGTK